MSSIYQRKRNGKNDGYVMYSTYAYDPLRNKKRYFNITLGKLGPALTWNDCIKKQKELDKVFDIKKGGKENISLNKAIEIYLEYKKIYFKTKPPKPSTIKLISYHLKTFKEIIISRYGKGIMIKHINMKILVSYFAIRDRELKDSSMEVHTRIIRSFFDWGKN